MCIGMCIEMCTDMCAQKSVFELRMHTRTDMSRDGCVDIRRAVPPWDPRTLTREWRVMAYKVMACMIMACKVMACMILAYIAMVYIVMAYKSRPIWLWPT